MIFLKYKIGLPIVFSLLFTQLYGQDNAQIIKSYSRNGTTYSSQKLIILESGNYIDNSSLYFQNATEKILTLLNQLLIKSSISSKISSQILLNSKKTLIKENDITKAIENINSSINFANDSLTLDTISKNKFTNLLNETQKLAKIADIKKIGNDFFANTTKLKGQQSILFQSDFNNCNIIPIKKHNVYGYIDSLGSLVLDYQFDEATRFQNNLAVVKKNGEYFFIYKSGQVKNKISGIQKIYSFNDTSLFCLVGNHLSIIDTLGIRTDLYNRYSVLKENLISSKHNLIILRDNSKYNVLNQKGELLYVLNYSEVKDVTDKGICTIRIGSYFGYFDLINNKLISDTRYLYAEPFNYDLAIVKNSEGKFGLINTNNFTKLEFGSYNIERIENSNLLKLKKNIKKSKYFITTENLVCLEGECTID